MHITLFHPLHAPLLPHTQATHWCPQHPGKCLPLTTPGNSSPVSQLTTTQPLASFSAQITFPSLESFSMNQRTFSFMLVSLPTLPPPPGSHTPHSHVSLGASTVCPVPSVAGCRLCAASHPGVGSCLQPLLTHQSEGHRQLSCMHTFVMESLLSTLYFMAGFYFLS
ncbi:hypothetical protein E2C01_012540 [Portunus trituberculatus]|uniref:Uncharacterized protein n=1 Tax=Portunus trituberculatus TaxID=210409 RepID=A0A5B7DE61_PORTR|nr:hypothetical protein [Portunus trituberculatus]